MLNYVRTQTIVRQIEKDDTLIERVNCATGYEP